MDHGIAFMCDTMTRSTIKICLLSYLHINKRSITYMYSSSINIMVQTKKAARWSYGMKVKEAKKEKRNKKEKEKASFKEKSSEDLKI